MTAMAVGLSMMIAACAIALIMLPLQRLEDRHPHSQRSSAQDRPIVPVPPSPNETPTPPPCPVRHDARRAILPTPPNNRDEAPSTLRLSQPQRAPFDGRCEPPKSPPASPYPTAVRPEDIATLARALRAAHAAFLTGKYEAAKAELGKVDSLPKLPEHFAKYERLKLLAGYAENFQSALKRAVAGLHPGDDIQVGNSDFVVFVDGDKDWITLRVQGVNRTWTINRLPVPLVVAIADRWLNKDDPVSWAVKGAYLASVHDDEPEHKEERKAKARQWLQEASKKGIEGNLHKVLDDTYDLEQDLPLKA